MPLHDVSILTPPDIKLASVVLGATQATIGFSGISPSYSHLLVEMLARGDASTTFVNVDMQLNGDTGSNYDTQDFGGNASSTSANATSAQSSAFTGNILGATASSNCAGYKKLFIPYYSSTTYNKLWFSDYLYFGTLGTGSSYVSARMGGGWRSTAAINQITFLLSSGNFAAGSIVTLYGIL